MTHCDDEHDTRAELVRAAKALLHEQGFERTSLRSVAERARVSLADLHAHFQSKEALTEAVVSAHRQGLLELFASWTHRHAEPQQRLRCLVRAPLDAAAELVRFGCPHGSLCQELEKLEAGSPLAGAGARLMAVYLDWAEAQFELGGRPAREARALAEQLVSSIQGTLLIAHTLGSDELMAAQLRRIEQWLDESVAQLD